jgi:hypothetical protein
LRSLASDLEAKATEVSSKNTGIWSFGEGYAIFIARFS